MSHIRILPEILSNKIAAGEVVERPSSVVKELLENSIDAGATQIAVELENGGKSLVRVSDNGTGMQQDDALLAIERYATSKISKDSDLFSIRTLGFRGEALPSIAAVSRLSIVTRHPEALNGVAIQIDGGKIMDVSEIGAPVGTMVTVRRIFYNTPARRKFLKTVATEMGHTLDVVSHMAMGRGNVQFKIIHNGKIVKSWASVQDPFERIIDVLGREFLHTLHKVAYNSHPLTLSGWISHPDVTRSSSRGIHVFINGRYVRDRLIRHALMQGYAQKLVKGQFPIAVLFIDLPFESVDVNVHPTKHEVRFADGRPVYHAVAAAVADVLHRVTRPEWPIRNFQEDSGPKVSEPMSFFPQSHRSKPAAPSSTGVRQWKPPGGEVITRSPLSEPEVRPFLWDHARFKDLRVIGQLQNTYILCESGEGLILIDQHAAHERILFEDLTHRPSVARIATQRLLIPETVDLGYAESEILEKLMPELRRYGFEIESFGRQTFVVKGVPLLLVDSEITPLLLNMIDHMMDVGVIDGVKTPFKDCLVMMACHAAIRAHQALSEEEINALLHRLDACEHPSYCPHGRPVWVRWTNQFLEKAFKRTV